MAHQAASAIGNRMASVVNPLRRLESTLEGTTYTSSSAEEAFLGVFDGPITMHKYTDRSCTVASGCRAWASRTETTISVGKEGVTNHYLFIHEIFHTLDIVVLGNAANETLLAAQQAAPNFPNRPNLNGPSDLKWGFAGENFSEWQKSRSGASGEEFADMGIGWTYNQWDTDADGLTDFGRARANFMDVNMAIWLDQQIP